MVIEEVVFKSTEQKSRSQSLWFLKFINNEKFESLLLQNLQRTQRILANSKKPQRKTRRVATKKY